MKRENKDPKIGIFIIAYNAAQTVISAYRRIPTSLKRKAMEIYVFDDCSDDNTYYTGLGYKIANKVKNFVLYKNPKNLGYGGNQKKGYRYAIRKGFDIVVMLHGDAQYAPEKMPLLLMPFYSSDKKKIGMVMGSRMLGDPLKGGMPLYKFIGNKFLTWLENLVLGTNLSEFHSGYRAFNVHALKSIPFERCSNDFQFDTEIIIMLLKAGYNIVEVPIPTYYGFGSRSYVNVFRYGLQCLKSVLDYRIYQLGLKKSSIYQSHNVYETAYVFKQDSYSSHLQIAGWIKKLKKRSVLDVGCAGGFLVKALGKKWKGELFGVEKNPDWKTSEYLVSYKKVVWADLEKEDFGKLFSDRKFEIVVLADILEHLQNPKKILLSIKQILLKDGVLIISLPNASYLPTLILRKLFPGFRMTRGPLDRTHKNFYNPEETRRLLRNLGFSIERESSTPFPFQLIYPSFSSKSFIYRLHLVLSQMMPNFFGYQFLCLAKKT